MSFDFIQFLKQLPFSRLIFPLIAGILFALNFPINTTTFIFLFFGIFIFFLLSIKLIYKSKNYTHRWIPGFIINLLLISGGIILLKVNEPDRFRTYDKTITGAAVISEPVSEKENSYKSILQSVSYLYHDTLINEKSKIIVYFSKNPKVTNLKYGDKIIFRGRISEIKNPGNPHEFNYKRYLFRKGITGQIFLNSSDYKCISHHNADFIFDFAYDTRKKLENIYKENGISGKELSVLQALTLGDRSEIDDEIKQSYIASGAMHILAVSGLHVGIIYMLFNFLLGFLNKLKYKKTQIGKIIKACLLILILWSFAVLSGLSPSIRRAAVMFTFVILGRVSNRHVNIYNSVAASAFILLIINPYQITEVGFQLSYAAVLGIIFFHPKLLTLFKIKNRILYYLWSLTAVSVAAQISTFPITLYYFHIFPILFFLSNIIVIPAATVILISAFLLLVTSPFPYFSNFIAAFLNYILKFLNGSVSVIENIPHSTINNISFHGEDLIIAFLIIISASVFILLKKVKSLQFFLILLIVWISFGSFRKITKSKHPQLTIYNIKNYTAVDITARKNYFISEKSIFQTKNITYGIHPNRQYLNKSDFQFIPTDTAEYNSVFLQKTNTLLFAGNKSILLLSEKNNNIPNVKSKITVDYVILSGKNNVNLKNLTNNVNFKLLIFDSSNSFRMLEKRKRICGKLHINYYSIKDKGAFQIFL